MKKNGSVRPTGLSAHFFRCAEEPSVVSTAFKADTLSGYPIRTVRNGLGGHFPFPLGKCLSGLSARSRIKGKKTHAHDVQRCSPHRVAIDQTLIGVGRLGPDGRPIEQAQPALELNGAHA
jgi:hypothetical protein